MKDIAEQLKAAVREAVAAGWSVNAIAKATGVSQPSLHRWLSGEREDLALSSAVKLAEWFGTELKKPRIPKPE